MTVAVRERAFARWRTAGLLLPCWVCPPACCRRLVFSALVAAGAVMVVRAVVG